MIVLRYLSLACNCTLWAGIIYEYFKVRKHKDNVYYNMILVISVVVLAAFYIYSINARKMVYTWDYANYYKIQLRLHSYFDNGVVSALKSVAYSLLMDDYNCLIGVFCAFLFEIFNVDSVNAYIMIYFCVCIIPVITAFSFMVRQFAKKFEVKNTRRFYTTVMAAFVLMPLVNYSALLGQPDIFGLVFVMMLIFMALSYDFAKQDIFAYIFLFVNTILLMLTRRWYIYWVASFFVIWFITLAITERNKRSIKNMLIFAAASVVIGTAGLFPMIKRILLYDYGDRYSFYNLGGMKYEIYNQFSYLGLLICALIIAGIVAGIIFKKTRAAAVSTTASILACMVMITRVQNTAEHQSLIYVTGYIILIMIFLRVMEELLIRKYGVITGIICLAVTGNAVVCSSGISRIIPKPAGYVFAGIDTSPVVREDWEDLTVMYEYIKQLLADGSEMYIIPHGKNYNPDTFRNYTNPGSMDDVISYGACVLGTHIFPVEFLSARYIMTCSPIDDLDTAGNSIVKNLDAAAAALASEQKLKTVGKFVFDNGYTFIIYERTEKADTKEIQYLKELFYYQSQKYPEDFEQVLDGFLTD